MGPFHSYNTKGHHLSKVDARIKLLVALSALILVLSSRGFTFPILVTLCCVIIVSWLRVPLKVVLLRFSEPLFIAAVVILLKFFFSGKVPLFTVHLIGLDIIGYRDGLHQGLFIGNRILAAVSLVSVLGFSTPFTEFMAGLSWFRVPRGFIEILMFAYRYLFVLFEDAEVIYTAQKNRLGYSTVKRGLSSLGTLAGSLTIKAFDHSQNTTVAMVQRGYDGELPLLRHKSFRSTEVLATALILLVMGLVWKI